MENNKKVLSVDELIENKVNILKSKNEKYKFYVKKINGYIEYSLPTLDDILDFTSMFEKGDYSRGLKMLIYSSVKNPYLKSKKLQKAYGVKEPFDIVSKLFDIKDVLGLSTLIQEKLGLQNGGNLIDELKK